MAKPAGAFAGVLIEQSAKTSLVGKDATAAWRAALRSSTPPFHHMPRSANRGGLNGNYYYCTGMLADLAPFLRRHIASTIMMKEAG